MTVIDDMAMQRASGITQRRRQGMTQYNEPFGSGV